MTNSDNWITMNPSEYAAYNGIKEIDTDSICECDFCELKNDTDTDTDSIVENDIIDNEMPCGCVSEDFCKCNII